MSCAPIGRESVHVMHDLSEGALCPRGKAHLGWATLWDVLSEHTGNAGRLEAQCPQPVEADISTKEANSLLPSRPGELHPEPLTDPDLILSHHPARAIE
jgi:hypothetical protein